MTKSQTIGARLGLAMLGAGLVLSAAPSLAQTGNPGLDSPGEALSRNLRSLAENPKSIAALIGAGKAALELGDPSAAITFFGRAEEQAPRDGRIKMWLGASLVQLQQAQGALKFFAEAVSLGAPEAEVAGARGLAYDLLGDPRRAQRDYRLALQSKPSAEVSRHLALSLAISGEREAALQALEGQLLIRDRAAERTRVFVLALTGDAAGAARAVQTSMPAQSAAMTPFLERLPALTPAERALAVHLGHFPSRARNLPVPAPNTYAAYTPSTARAGAPDPRQPALGSRPGTRTQPGQRQAAATPPPAKPAATQPQRVASAAPAAQTPKAEPGRRALPSSGPPADSAWAWSRGTVTTRRSEPAAPKLAESKPADSKPAAEPAQQQAAAIKPSAPATQQVASLAPARTDQLQQIASAIPAPAAQPQQITSASSLPRNAPAQQPAAPATVTAAPVQQQLAAAVPTPSPQTPVQTAALAPSAALSTPGFSIAAAQPQQQPTSEMTSVEEAPPPASGVGEQNGASRLAGIASLIATLPDSKAAEEMTAVPEQAKPAPAAKPAPKPAAPAPAAAKKDAPVKVAAKKETPAATPKASPAAAKKETPAPVKKPAAPAEPSRVWVQVAGGADKAALPREFTRLKAKAPKLLAARTAWTTPLKATNRLLVGPFKTDKEAQDFVNELKKVDLTGFAWTSDAGQKIEKLSAK